MRASTMILLIAASMLLSGAVLADEQKLPASTDFVPVEVLPELVAECPPAYPDSAKAENLEGDVWLQALVDRDGAVDSVRIAKTSGHPILDRAALKAGHRCRYSPAEVQGEPVAIWITYKVTFKLEDKD